MNPDKDLSYLEHLEILRKKIIIVLGCFILFIVISFIFIDKIIVFLKFPISNLKIDLNFIKPQEKLTTYLKIAFFSGIFFSIPFALIQLANFVTPALKKNEKSSFYFFVFFTIILFYLGCFLSYRFLAPFVFDFFINFAKSDGVKPIWTISEYFNFLLTLIFLTGLSFLYPIILLFLIKIGIISTKTLSKFRRHAILIIFIIAAIITPTVDMFTQIIIGVVLYILFEITIMIGKVIEVKSVK